MRHKNTMDNKTTQLLGLISDGMVIAVPQAEVISVDVAANIQLSAKDSKIGEIAFQTQFYPVFGLSATLQIQPDLAATRRFCVLLGTAGQPAFALACDTVKPLLLDHAQMLQALPAAMQSANTPITYLVQHEQQMLFVTSTEALVTYFASLESLYADN